MQTQTPYRVVLADDHAQFRQGLKEILSDDCKLEVVGDACDGVKLLEILNLAENLPQLAIVDISMPNLGGIDVTARIRRQFPGMKVLIVSGHKSKEYVANAMLAGAHGYLLKEDVSAHLFMAIEKIRQGGVYLSPVLNEDMPE